MTAAYASFSLTVLGNCTTHCFPLYNLNRGGGHVFFCCFLSWFCHRTTFFESLIFLTNNVVKIHMVWSLILICYFEASMGWQNNSITRSIADYFLYLSLLPYNTELFSQRSVFLVFLFVSHDSSSHRRKLNDYYFTYP